ncbi:hypothetical protein ELH82_34905, partial [Rhizobium leguminosarum]
RAWYRPDHFNGGPASRQHRDDSEEPVVPEPGKRCDKRQKPHMRLLTLVTSLAWFWYYWLLGIVAVLAAGWATIEVIGTIRA